MPTCLLSCLNLHSQPDLTVQEKQDIADVVSSQPNVLNYSPLPWNACTASRAAGCCYAASIVVVTVRIRTR